MIELVCTICERSATPNKQTITRACRSSSSAAGSQRHQISSGHHHHRLLAGRRGERRSSFGPSGPFQTRSGIHKSPFSSNIDRLGVSYSSLVACCSNGRGAGFASRSRMCPTPCKHPGSGRRAGPAKSHLLAASPTHAGQNDAPIQVHPTPTNVFQGRAETELPPSNPTSNLTTFPPTHEHSISRRLGVSSSRPDNAASARSPLPGGPSWRGLGVPAPHQPPQQTSSRRVVEGKARLGPGINPHNTCPHAPRSYTRAPTGGGTPAGDVSGGGGGAAEHGQEGLRVLAA